MGSILRSTKIAYFFINLCDAITDVIFFMCIDAILGCDIFEKKRSIRCDFDYHPWKIIHIWLSDMGNNVIVIVFFCRSKTYSLINCKPRYFVVSGPISQRKISSDTVHVKNFLIQLYNWGWAYAQASAFSYLFMLSKRPHSNPNYEKVNVSER